MVKAAVNNFDYKHYSVLNKDSKLGAKFKRK